MIGNFLCCICFRNAQENADMERRARALDELLHHCAYRVGLAKKSQARAVADGFPETAHYQCGKADAYAEIADKINALKRPSEGNTTEATQEQDAK